MNKPTEPQYKIPGVDYKYIVVKHGEKISEHSSYAEALASTDAESFVSSTLVDEKGWKGKATGYIMNHNDDVDPDADAEVLDM